MKETDKANFGRVFWYAITNGNPENLPDQDWETFDDNEEALAWFEEQKHKYSPDSSLYLKHRNGNIERLG